MIYNNIWIYEDLLPSWFYLLIFMNDVKRSFLSALFWLTVTYFLSGMKDGGVCLHECVIKLVVLHYR